MAPIGGERGDRLDVVSPAFGRYALALTTRVSLININDEWRAMSHHLLWIRGIFEEDSKMRIRKIFKQSTFIVPLGLALAAIVAVEAAPDGRDGRGAPQSQPPAQNVPQFPAGGARGPAGPVPHGNAPISPSGIPGRGTGQAGAPQNQGPGRGVPPQGRVFSPTVPMPEGGIAHAHGNAGPPRAAAPEYNFRGRDFARLTPQQRTAWQGGRWLHDWHDGRLGWWWVTSGIWYFYPEPIYPYPLYISEYLIPPPPVLSARYWYYCDDPPGYYPDVQACYDPWQMIPVTPPPPYPNAAGPQPTAEVRAGYRIAQDVCSECHVVRPGQANQPILVQPGPSFEEIANRPDTTADSLSKFISGTRWDLESRPITMPNQGLSERSTTEVVAYIMSLKR